jgi:hypothetical protein
MTREPHSGIGKEETVSSPSDAEVIGRSLEEPEAFGLIYDRHAATVRLESGPDTFARAARCS